MENGKLSRCSTLFNAAITTSVASWRFTNAITDRSRPVAVIPAARKTRVASRCGICAGRQEAVDQMAVEAADW
jgi:hypothetical protein